MIRIEGVAGCRADDRPRLASSDVLPGEPRSAGVVLRRYQDYGRIFGGHRAVHRLELFERPSGFAGQNYDRACRYPLPNQHFAA